MKTKILQNLILILVLLMTVQCTALKKEKVNRVKNESNFKNVRFDYFRTVIYVDNEIAGKDTIKSLYLSKRGLVIKKGVNGKDDTKFVFTSYYESLDGMLWTAYFYGDKDEMVYIEYLKDKSITIKYIDRQGLIYTKRRGLIRFIHVSQIENYKPLPKKGIWYLDIPGY